MHIGIVGLGNLGFCLAVAIEQKGHNVMGYDIRKESMKLELKCPEAKEDGKGDYSDIVKQSKLKFASSIDELVSHSDIVKIAVQTPPGHPDHYGTTRVYNSGERYDYNYDYLISAVSDVNAAATTQKKNIIIDILCTVLPGTIRTKIWPILGEYSKLAYSPILTAMGTVVQDYYYPEFVILGICDDSAHQTMVKFYKTICDADIHSMTLENAELVKMCYNTAITTKICLANTIMQMCDKLPNTDSDVVMKSLKSANRRITSAAYLNGGMVDSGICHAKDLRSLWWKARELNLTFDLYDALVLSTESQTRYLAEVVHSEHLKHPLLPIVIIGRSFKENANIEGGSATFLLKEIMEEEFGLVVKNHWDPVCHPHLVQPWDNEPILIMVATKHDVFQDIEFPEGSVVVDPFRFMTEYSHTKYRKIGKNV
jgi:UDPglucose 6-dehydrogenase